MSRSWKRVLAVTVGAICLIVASLPGSVEAHGKHPGRARRVKSCTTKGDVRMTRSVAGHTVNYALGRHQLQDRVTQADIDRAVSEMYDFLKRKLGNPTAVCAQYISTGYGHFERAYSDEARAMLLGVRGLNPNGARSKFDVKRHGLNFVNSFQSKMIVDLPHFGKVDLASSGYGLCGGMIYAGHDSYWYESTSGQLTKSPDRPGGRSDIPPQGSRLRGYLWDRQMDSLKAGKWWAVRKLAKWKEKSLEELKRLSSLEFTGKIAPRIDQGWAVPLLVVQSKKFTMNHQVLAIGYKQDVGYGRKQWVIGTYDPNCPDMESKLYLESRRNSCGGVQFRGFFVSKYRGQRPYWAAQRGGPGSPGSRSGSPRDPWGTGGKGPAQPETLPKDPR